MDREDAAWEPCVTTGKVEERLSWPRAALVWVLLAAFAWAVVAATGFGIYKLVGLAA